MDPLDPFSARSSESIEIFVGAVVVDDKGPDVPLLIVEALETTAAEYVLKSSVEGRTTTLHDRYPRASPDDPVYVVLPDSVIRRSFPEWREGDSREVLSSYRSGSFRQASKVLPESLLTPIEDVEAGIGDRDDHADRTDTEELDKAIEKELGELYQDDELDREPSD